MTKLMISILAFLFSVSGFAAGTSSISSQTTYDYSLGGTTKRVKKIKVAWTGSASDGTVPSLSIPMYGYLLKVVTDPGSTAPTDNYDIALGDPDDASFDALGGALADRDTTSTEQVYPVKSGAVTPYFLAGTYTLSISNNSTHSATGTIYFYLVDQF